AFVEVVVTVGHAQTAQAGRGDLLGGVFGVGARVQAQARVDAGALERDDRRRERGDVVRRGDRVEQRRDGRRAGAFDRAFVHAGAVARAQLLRVAAGGGV